MSSKKYDLAVKVGTYQTPDGKEKGRYENVGAVIERPEGGKFILLNRTFNPAGVPNPDGRSTVIISMFEPKGAKQESVKNPDGVANPEDVVWNE